MSTQPTPLDAPKKLEEVTQVARTMLKCIDEVSDEDDRALIQKALDDVIAECACGLQQREAAAARMNVIRQLTPFQNQPRVARLLCRLAKKQLEMCDAGCIPPAHAPQHAPPHAPQPHTPAHAPQSQQLRPLPSSMPLSQPSPPPQQPHQSTPQPHAARKTDNAQAATHQPQPHAARKTEPHVVTPPQPVRHTQRDSSPELVVPRANEPIREDDEDDEMEDNNDEEDEDEGDEFDDFDFSEDEEDEEDEDDDIPALDPKKR